jgi:uncharacterized protein
MTIGPKSQRLVQTFLSGAIVVFAFVSRDFRRNGDNFWGGVAIGLCVVAGWYITGSALGSAWKEWAEFQPNPPSRVEVQSYTFISPMADVLRYLRDPANVGLINFGVMALIGVLVGSFLYALLSRTFRVEWFSNTSDALRHAVGGALMGIGGVLSMGCTIGQAVTGFSTLALDRS